jgi:K+-transporting ATPase KdpC subunit
MLREIRPAIILLLLLTAITGLAYPLAMTAIAGAIFPKQAQGSLIEKDGKVVGSALIGQEFKDDKYFHGRPSATLAPDPADSTKTVSAPYNAANSGGSNLGPTSKALNDRVKEDVEKLKAENPSAAVPADLVTTSRISLRKARCSKCRAWPRSATCRRIASASSSPRTPKGALPGCSASRASTSWRSTWHWMRHPNNGGSSMIRKSGCRFSEEIMLK